MSSSLVQTKRVGTKKLLMDSKGLMDNIRDHDISKSFAVGNVCHSFELLCDFYTAGGNLNCRDSKTGETFLHVLSDYTHLYLTANGTRIMYLISTKVDLDVPDSNGDTALHKVVRTPGAWRCIVALMRCGSCPLIKNRAGRTAEEEILHQKSQGWKENAHWLRKYMPGLWAAVKSQNPDPILIERLLRCWCRTVKIIGTETENLKCQVHMCETQLDTVCILEKYENTNEMALSMLSGKTQLISMWKNAENLQRVNVNTKDHSYQFYYRDYPTAPRPLLAAVWEIDQIDLIRAFMELNPDTSVKYTFESEAASPPKPLFFQLVNPKSRPQNEEIITTILRDADLNTRNIQGQTVLVEAMYSEETEGVIRIILNSGINVGARDSHGRTARDHCYILQREDYRQLIDSHLFEMIQDCDIDRLEALVLQLYDYVIPPLNKSKIMNLMKQKNSRQLQELLKNMDCTQAHVRKLFSIVKSGNKTQLVKHMSRKYGNSKDKAGRCLLHCAIQHSQSSNTQDSMGQRLNNSQTNTDNTTENREIILGDISVINIDNGDAFINSDTRQLYRDQPPKKCVRKRGQCFKKLLCSKDCPPDYIGCIKYLVEEFPFMVGLTNNFGQTPLHYAHIFSASKEVIDLLEKSGAYAQLKDVYDFVPEDYDFHLCGAQTFNVRRQPTVDLDLDIFLTESNFEERFQQAVQTGDVEAMKKLIPPLLEHGGESKFSSALFDCLDRGHTSLATFLVESGFNVDISKQYEVCDPDDAMCAMMECSHAVTSLRQRAVDTGANFLVRLIDSMGT